MEYPAIVYSLADYDTLHADNGVYLNTKRYTVIVIDKDPDSLIPDKMLLLPMCDFDRHYKKNNLNHYVFNLYY